MYWRSACQFSQDFWWGLGWGVHLYWVFMRLGFTIQNLGNMDFLSYVDRSDRYVALMKIQHLFNYSIYSPFIPILIKYSIMCESLWH